MKALSIKQHWLWCITDLDKYVENRTWQPPNWIIGQRIALHASAKPDPHSLVAIREITGEFPQIRVPLGAIVATAIVAGWVYRDGISHRRSVDVATAQATLKSRWFFGPYGWILEDIQKLPEPYPWSGALGLWEVPAPIVRQIERAE